MSSLDKLSAKDSVHSLESEMPIEILVEKKRHVLRWKIDNLKWKIFSFGRGLCGMKMDSSWD